MALSNQIIMYDPLKIVKDFFSPRNNYFAFVITKIFTAYFSRVFFCFVFCRVLYSHHEIIVKLIDFFPFTASWFYVLLRKVFSTYKIIKLYIHEFLQLFCCFIYIYIFKWELTRVTKLFFFLIN